MNDSAPSTCPTTQEGGSKLCKLRIRAVLDWMSTKKRGVACVLITYPDGTLQREIRPCSTMTADLVLLNEWLETLQVSVVALESTGVFWRPVFNLLEDGRTIVLVNPQRVLCGAWTQDGCQGCRVVG